MPHSVRGRGDRKSVHELSYINCSWLSRQPQNLDAISGIHGVTAGRSAEARPEGFRLEHDSGMKEDGHLIALVSTHVLQWRIYGISRPPSSSKNYTWPYTRDLASGYTNHTVGLTSFARDSR